MPIAEQTPDGKWQIFWRAKCRVTGRELKFRSSMPFFPTSEDVMREWVGRFFRELELLEYRPWSHTEDGHRIDYPVPVQHVKFKVPVPSLAQPDPRRLSLFISRPSGASLLGGQSLLKGA